MQNRTIKLLCLFTALIMLLCSCSAGSDDSEAENNTYVDKSEPQTVKISLPYSAGDSLNPFFAVGKENSALAFLFCQPLFEIKSDYTAEPALAESYEAHGTDITVHLKTAYFSDSSSVTAYDAVYSFNLAKTSPAYSQRLGRVSAAAAVGNSVVFSFDGVNPLSVNALCFPIVKRDTADSADDLPIGSGVFVMKGDDTMVISSTSQAVSTINTVELYKINKAEYITNELEVGNFNYLLEELADGSYKGINAQNKTIVLNNLVYLGFNHEYGALSSAAVRTAIFNAIDRETISSSAYQGYCKATVTPFNPELYLLKNINLPSVRANLTKSESILQKMGYSVYNDNGLRTNGENVLEFSLTVNSSNSFRTVLAHKVAEELKKIGIRINVDEVSDEVYKSRIASGSFQMYIGEVKLTESMDLAPFLGGGASKGIDQKLPFSDAYGRFLKGEITFEAMLESFYDDMMLVPICYRAGIAAYSSIYIPDFSYAPYNIYGNIENWEVTK
ncbi:MAG: hypothetical protein IJL63_03890 [Clostridia bacterium]|nr:hypothetical protein [Clostridia bacterium]